MEIKIISDIGEVYEEGRVMSAKRLIEDFLDCVSDYDDTKHFFKNIGEKSSVEFIAKAWGLQYEILKK